MKIYIQDNGWRGIIIVIATSEEAARDIMKDEYNYKATEDVDVFDIEDGFLYATLGDS